MIDEVEGRLEVKLVGFRGFKRIYKDGKQEEASHTTYVYMSRNAMEGRPFNKRDDWESLLYIIYELTNGQLPWHREMDHQTML
jgi:hypothetical protein